MRGPLGSMRNKVAVDVAGWALGFDTTPRQYVIRAQPGPVSPPPPTLREFTRRQIDTILKEHAKLLPVYATARRAVILAAIELKVVDDEVTSGACSLLFDLHLYESFRARGMRPERAAQELVPTTRATADVLAVYERVRAMGRS
jgi:hypothetical protein